MDSQNKLTRPNKVVEMVNYVLQLHLVWQVGEDGSTAALSTKHW